MLGWTGDNGDPDNFLCYFFCQPGAAREGFYANTALADLLLRAQKLTIQAERARLYRQAEQMLHDDVGRLFIANNQPPLAFSKRAKGNCPHPPEPGTSNRAKAKKAPSQPGEGRPGGRKPAHVSLPSFPS